MSSYPGYIPLGGPISPTDTSDTYPVTDTQFSLGGPWQVANFAALSSITLPRRRIGAIATTQDTNHQYQLQGGIFDANWVDITGGGGGGWSPVLSVTLGATFATNQAFKLVGGVALPVTSLDASQPNVDGVTLESGVATNVVPCAMISQNLYTTPLALPPGSPLFLGQDGKPTATEPLSSAGDVWSVSMLRQDDSTHFIFAPTTPIKLA